MADQHNPGEHGEPSDAQAHGQGQPYGQGQPQGVPPQGVPQQPDGAPGKPGAAASAAGALGTASQTAATAETAIGFWKGLRKAAEKLVNKIRGKEDEEVPASTATAQAQPPVASQPAAPADSHDASSRMDKAKAMVKAARENVAAFSSEKKDAIVDMNWTNKSTAVGGAALAAEGGINTVRNLKDKRFGRAIFSATRCAVGAVMTYGTFQAHATEGDKHVIDWGKRILQERLNKGPKQQGI